MSILEKINTVMLCDLMSHLKVESSINPETVKYAVESGNLWILEAEYSVLGQEQPSKNVRDLTVSILNMYRGLSKALRGLPLEEKNALVSKHKLKLDDNYIQIHGFDGNNETDYLSVIEAFQAINRFTEQKEPIRNTHSQTIYSYENMLEKYNSLDPWNRSNDLSKEEVSSVLQLAPMHF